MKILGKFKSYTTLSLDFQFATQNFPCIYPSFREKRQMKRWSLMENLLNSK